MRFAQHNRPDVILLTFFCHSERSEESSVDASLRFRFAQHDKLFWYYACGVSSLVSSSLTFSAALPVRLRR